MKEEILAGRLLRGETLKFTILPNMKKINSYLNPVGFAALQYFSEDEEIFIVKLFNIWRRPKNV